MRKVFEPVIPTACLCGTMAAILVVAVPLVKLAVESIFSMLGY